MSRITSFARVAVAYELIVSRRHFAHFRRDSYRGLGGNNSVLVLAMGRGA